MLFAFIKIVHILCAIFFIGVVGFRTFIMPSLKSHFSADEYKKIESISGKRARGIIKINNLFLIGSGLYLFGHYMGSASLMLLAKATLGLVLALTFYVVPHIMAYFKNTVWFSEFFHYLFFGLMMVTVILSQMMQYLA